MCLGVEASETTSPNPDADSDGLPDSWETGFKIGFPPPQYRITRDKNRRQIADFGAPNNSAGGEISSILPVATKAT